MATNFSTAGVEQMTVLTMKAFHDNCSKLSIVDKPDAADYFVRLDRNGTLISVLSVKLRDGQLAALLG